MARFAFEVTPSDPQRALGLELWLDNQCVFDNGAVMQAITVAHEFDDDDNGDHEFRIVLKNKHVNFCTVNDDGDIVSDSVLELSKFTLEDIDISQIVFDRAVYQHDFNGSADSIDDLFFGAMGCNGTVTLKFSTPIYVWLLEVM